MFLSLSIVVVGCGQVAPSGTAPGSAGSAPTGAPAQAVATGGGPSSAISASPTDGASTPVNRAIDAAIAYAKSTLQATHPSVAEAGQGLFDPSDPTSEVWVVHLVGDTFQSTPCPQGTPQISYGRSCGSGTQAILGLRIDDLKVVDVEIDSTPATPIAQSQIQLPPNAKLPTREAAIEAALGSAPIDGNSPHVVSVDLILAGQDPALNDLSPDTPVWRISLDHGQYAYSCPAVPPGVPKPDCESTSTTMWIEAITGFLRVQSYPMATPTP
jgi:hypothetical protein